MTIRDTKSTTRRNAALGVTAGLLGGGAIGLMLGVPGVSSAANDDAVAIVSAFQDPDDPTDTSNDTTVDTTVDDSVDHPIRTERARDLLQELVDDGTITSEQADAVAQHLAANRPHLGGRHERFGGHGHHGSDLAELLGVGVDTLRDGLRSGQSIADIAAANGVDIQTVIDAMIADATERIDRGVENGRLTEEQAAARIAELTDKVTERVNQAPPVRD